MIKVNFIKSFLIVAFAMLVGLQACKKSSDNEPTPIVNKGKTITVSGNITKDSTWKVTDTIILSGFVYVKNATLTIEAGTIIKGEPGSKATLIIEQGSKIMAVGSTSKPIVFTSGKAAGQRGYGDWGGIIICGKAKTNKHDGGTGSGIAEGGIGSTYGGSDDADNSGKLQYVRIEFAGIPLTATANSEINGLTLYAVGSATTIDHIQVSYSGDDSYEWFGGSVNCKYLVAFRGWDDEFDTDNGYNGKLQFLVSLRDPKIADQSGSNCFESDNDADGSTLTPVTHAIFSNVSVFGPLNGTETSTSINVKYENSMQIRRGSTICIYNSIFAGYPVGLYIDGAKGNAPTKAEDNTLQIENCIMSGMSTNFKVASGTPATPYTLAQLQAYYEKTERANSTLTTLVDLKITNPFSLTAPNFLPATGSPALTGGLFTNANLSDAFFDKTATFKGAFGTSDWTSGWCNWDPQNTKY